MQTNTPHFVGWRCLVAVTLLLFMGQAAMVGAEESPVPSNVPPPGFTALFNGTDFTGWRMSPKAKEMWFIEDGVLKSPGLLRQWGADLVTEKEFRDFVLMIDFRMPSLSDSGIMFRRLVPEIPNFGDQEQFNLRSKDGVGHLESFYFLPHGIARNRKLREEDEPHVRLIDPEIGVWHTVKLTMQGRTLSAEYDGEVLYDRFTYPDWMMNLEPAPIRLQKHVFFDDDDALGKMNPCPIEYRNIFIKETKPSDATVVAPASSKTDDQDVNRQKSRPMDSSNTGLLARIDAGDLPEGYDPAKHQEYVDLHWPKLSPGQVARALQLWEEKQKTDPEMPNRGYSFVKIMTYVASEEKLIAEDNKQPESSVEGAGKSPGKTPESRSSRPVHAWKWSAADEQGTTRKASPLGIPERPTLFVVPFGLLEADNPPVVLLPESRLSVAGRLVTAQPVYFGVTVHHPNGDFAGRFLTMQAADEFESKSDFQVTLDLEKFQLDPSLVGMQDKLPATPFHFVVESIWFTTLEKDAGLEITELELAPRRTQNTRK
jgi:hypothetical protein